MNISKPHPNVQIRTSITINLSADQWALNTKDHPRVIIEKVADFLNKRITTEFNKGESRSTLELSINSLSDNFKIYGATKKESKEVLTNLLNELYKKDDA